MKKLLFIAVVLCLSASLSAEQKKDWGRVSASLESLNHVYVDDAANGFYPMSDPQMRQLKNRYATNNYLKVDYYKGRVAAGMQMEGYFPTVAGYPYVHNKLTISNLYFSWIDKSYSVTAGTFYEQLGSGMLFRSWEDRTLGLNNALLGVRGTYNYNDIFALRAFYGIPRLDKTMMPAQTGIFGLGLTNVHFAAADASFSLSECLGWERVSLGIEGSALYKHENLSAWMPEQAGCKDDNISYSARVNMDVDGFYLKGEYVGAGLQYVPSKSKAENGNAQMLEFGYNSKGLGVSVTTRRMHRMLQQIYTESIRKNGNEFVSYHPAANVISYCPAMCTQYTYMLTTLNPYSIMRASGLTSTGEAGGQIDAFYNFRRGTRIGGKRGMKVHANFSTYYSLNAEGGFKGGEHLFTDFSVDVERQWTKKFKMTLLYSLQDYNKKEKDYKKEEVHVGMSHAFVADLLYKWTSKFSTRLELQYLASKGYQKDWMAALLEVSFAPHWSVFASDMYNHGSSRMHYYNAGVSYAYKWIRVAAGYGRYRAGYICSGGVCREIPAYTGANITLTATF